MPHHPEKWLRVGRERSLEGDLSWHNRYQQKKETVLSGREEAF
jgi:hypothetical protein